MNNGKGSSVQLHTWLLTAMSAPLATIAGKSDWLINLITGAVCCGVCWLISKLADSRKRNPWLSAAQWVWMTLALAGIIGQSKQMWPDAGEGNLIPIVILVLGAWSVHGGVRRARAAGATLIWFVWILFAFAFTAGIKDVKLSYLVPSMDRLDPVLLFVYLLPLVTMFLPGNEGKKDWLWMVIILTFGVASSALTFGVLSETVVKTHPNPFYEMSRSLSLFGVARRFEAVVASAVTIGWYALASMMISAAVQLAGEINEEWCGWSGWVTAAAAAAVLCGFTISGVTLVIGSIVFWVILPILTQGIVKIKKL